MDVDFCKDILDNLYDGVYFVDRTRMIISWNKGAELLTGYSSSDVLGKSCSDNILIHIDDEGVNLCEGQCPLADAISSGCRREADVFLHHKEGHRVPVSVRVAPIQDSSGQIVGAVEIFSDNSSKIAYIQTIEELRRTALLDPQTEVANRRCVEMVLQSQIDEMRRYNGTFGVVFIDLDNFKTVNDMYGHDVGDQVLKMVARTLLNSSRSSDTLGRWGGDEFLAIILNTTEDQLHSISNRLRSIVEQSMLSVGSNVIRVTVSIGATLCQPNDTVDTLLKRVDKLLYESKGRGRNRATTKS